KTVDNPTPEAKTFPVGRSTALLPDSRRSGVKRAVMSEPNPTAPGTSPETTAAPPPAPANPPLPPKPAPPKPPPKTWPARRLSLVGSWINLGWITLTGSLAAMLLGTVRFLFPNVLSEPSKVFKAGLPDQYEENKVVDRFKELGAWIVRARDESGRDTIYSLRTTRHH